MTTTKAKLTAQNVNRVFMDCLFREGEAHENAVIVDIVSKFGFHPERLESHVVEIGALLNELPDGFRAITGGGWSFLQACMTKDGDQWGEHRDIEQLMALGIATKQATLLMERSMWAMFPGGMPYFSVSTKAHD